MSGGLSMSNKMKLSIEALYPEFLYGNFTSSGTCKPIVTDHDKKVKILNTILAACPRRNLCML